MVGRTPKKRRVNDDRLEPVPQTNSGYPAVGLPGEPLLAFSYNVDGITTSGDVSGLDEFPMPGIEGDSSFPNLFGEDLFDPSWEKVPWPSADDLLNAPEPAGLAALSAESTDSASAQRASLSGVSDQDVPGLLLSHDQRATSVRSRLSEKVQSVPPSYRDKALTSQYQHAAGLMNLIERLEDLLQTSRVPIDQAMQVNRQAMSKIREIIKMEEFRRCRSCPALVATMLDLALGLYELVTLSVGRCPAETGRVCRPDQSDASLQENLSLSSGDSMSSPATTADDPPPFQFGCLELDQEEQANLRRAILRRDLRQCRETIQYCGTEIPRQQTQPTNPHEGGNNVPSRLSSAQVHAQWYEDMERRALELSTSPSLVCTHTH
jgi:hypothetical protein